MIPDKSYQTSPGERYPVNPFDLSTDLFSPFSNQVIHLVIHLDGQIHYDILEKAVERASFAEPITRCRIIRDRDALFWQEASEFRISDHILLVRSLTPRDLLYQVLSYPLDPYLGNTFQVILIENTGKTGDIVVINVHHIVMDARGLKDFSRLIMQCYSAYLSGDQTDIPVTQIRSREVPLISTLITEPEQNLIQENPIGWCSRISVPLQSLHGDTFHYSIMTFDQNRTAIIQNIRRDWGITVNDFMIAALVRVITSILGVKSDITVPLYTTVDLRRYLPVMPERSLVNFSTSFEVRVPVKPDEILEDTGKRVHALMNRIKTQNPGVSEAKEAEELVTSGYAKARDLLNGAWKNIQDAQSKTTIFSNTGIISRDQVSTTDLSVRNAYILPGHFRPPGFFFLLSTFEDTMTLSASYAVPAYDPVVIKRMFASIDQDIPGYTRYPGKYSCVPD